MPVSARTGFGLDALRAALDAVAASQGSRAEAEGPALLHVDRVFTVVGRGTVVTGTLWSGAIALGDELEIAPRGVIARVRGVEIHDRPVARAAAGQRVAVNLAGVRVTEIARGDALATPGALQPTTILDCALTLRDAAHGERVQVHHGTRDAPGRLAALEGAGGGAARRCGGRAAAVRPRAAAVRRPRAGSGSCAWSGRCWRGPATGSWSAASRRRTRSAAASCSTPPPAATAAVPRSSPASARSATARPIPPPMPPRLPRLPPPRPRLPPPAAPAAASPRPPLMPPRLPRLPPRRPPLDPAARALAERLREAGAGWLSEAQLSDERAALRALREAGVAVRVSGRLYGDAAIVAAYAARVVALLERDGEVRLAGVRDALGIGRKSAQALLEHLDATGVTRRLDDDRRVPRRREPIA